MPSLKVRFSFSILLVGLLTLLLYHRTPTHLEGVLEGDRSGDISAGRYAPWCSPEECSTGRWEPRQPPFKSMDEFRKAYANRQDHVWKGCRAPPDPLKNSTSQEKVDEDRLMQVMSWTWTPYIGKMKEWNAEEFVIRLLKSPGGLILIGGT